MSRRGSLNRAKTRAIVEYEKLFRADSSLAQQGSADQELQLLQLLLSACITLEAFLPSVLRNRVFEKFRSNERILEAKVGKGVAPALICLIVQGSLPQSAFEMFT